MYLCRTCNQTLHLRNQRRHEQSQKHANQLARLARWPHLARLGTDTPTPAPVVRDVRVVREETERLEPELVVTEEKECPICFEPVPESAQGCSGCVQSWCIECDKNIFKCPYCRKSIPGRETELKEQESQLIHWYATSDAMAPDPHNARLTRILRMLTDFDTFFSEDPEVVQELYNWVIRGGHQRRTGTRTRGGTRRRTLPPHYQHLLAEGFFPNREPDTIIQESLIPEGNGNPSSSL